MSEDPKSRPYLAKLSELFSAEGDTETALALTSQLRSRPSRGMPEAEAQSVELLIVRANKACRAGDYDWAKPMYARALTMREEALGPDHLDSLCSMNDLARCMLNNGQFEQAKALYGRLLRIACTVLGADDKLTQITRDNIVSCDAAIERARGLDRLGRQLNLMYQEIRLTAELHQQERLDRLYAAGCRLEARGQYQRALPLFVAWADTRLVDPARDDDEAIKGLAHYASVLAKAGETSRSQAVHRRIVAIRNAQSRLGTEAPALQEALTDWADSLADLGDLASARVTLKLAARIA